MTPSKYIEDWELDNQVDSYVYEDEGDGYEEPERRIENERIHKRLYCNYPRCNKYLKVIEGYNGGCICEDGSYIDIRNSMFLCKDHQGTTHTKDDCF